jgi:predicted transcriptional regulator of viral defense system
MIEYGEMLIDSFGDYGNPGMKITRMVKSGQLIRLKNGLYETDDIIDIFQPAQAIYGPSYISFGTALSYYGIVPEHAFHVTNATFSKHKDKYFHTDICSYYYTDVPADVFHLEVETVRLGDYTYRIATREKAVCDKLYKMPPMGDVDQLRVLMFEDLRFDDEDIAKLDYRTVTELSERYGCKNIRLFSEYLGGLA